MTLLQGLAVAGGVFLTFTVLRDAFQTIILPRRPSGLRITRYYYAGSWFVTRAIAVRLSPGRRDGLLATYGPLFMISLIALWALLLVIAFGFIHWGVGSELTRNDGQANGLWMDFYMSGTTLFTLGMGDIFPATPLARGIAVTQAGLGLGFLALVIGYLPVLYGSFSRRETLIALLDARAGSPPTAGAYIERASAHGQARILALLEESETWAAELLESLLSYPVLAYYRSQHDHQSWLATLTALMDVSAVIIATGHPSLQPQARLTFAICRHVLIDFAALVRRPPLHGVDRLPPEDEQVLEALLLRSGFTVQPGYSETLAKLRATYEPHVRAVSAHLLMALPPWLPARDAHDDWESGMTAP